MLKTHGKSLDDESLLTLMTEIEGILNSRPLTVEMINDPSSFQPLAPANILTMKSKVAMPPPGKFLRPEDNGGGCNILPISSGLVGGRNTYKHCKSVRNGIQEEILLLVTLCY